MSETIIHQIFDMENEEFHVPKKVYKKLDRILESSVKDIKKTEPVETLRNIHSFLQKRIKGEGKVNNLLSRAFTDLRRSGLYCKRTFLYKAIGEVTELPIGIASMPGHMLPLWSDKNGIIYWESILAEDSKVTSQVCTAEEYVEVYDVQRKSINDGVYLKDLNTEEILSLAAFNIGLEFDGLALWNKAIEYYDKAIELNPKNPCAYYNRGFLFERQNNPAEAIKNYTFTLSLDKNYSKARFNRACMYDKLNKKEAAKKDFIITAKIDMLLIKYAPKEFQKSMIEAVRDKDAEDDDFDWSLFRKKSKRKNKQQ